MTHPMTLDPPIAWINLAGQNSNKVFQAARKAGIQGYITHNQNESFLLFRKNRRRLLLLIKSLDLNVRVEELSNGVFPVFHTLQKLETIPREIKKPTLWVEKPSGAGNIRGWAILPDHLKHATVEISIDNEKTAEVKANIFREDLLKNCIGFGDHMFLYRPPEKFMDGKIHKVTIGLVEDPTVTITKQMALPFHFNIKRPWVGIDVSSFKPWDKQAEVTLLQVREEIMYGDYSKGLQMARQLIEEYPAFIFRDFGIREYYMNRRQDLPTFKDRLDHRWGKFFDNQVCSLGESCCKNSDLSYNQSPGNKVQWTINDLLKKCPFKLRHFASKLATKKYAELMGVSTPQTLGVLSSVKDFDHFDFPQRYVLKPDFASGKGLYLMHGDLNLFSGLVHSKKDLRKLIADHKAKHPSAQFIVEEMLTQEDVSPDLPVIPLDYKFQVFGGKVRFLVVYDKNTPSRNVGHLRQTYLARDWSEAPFRIRETAQLNNPVKKPRCFDQLVQIADNIAKDLDDYTRVDLYATSNGPMLGEITTWSAGGVGYTDFGDYVFSQAWEIYHGNSSNNTPDPNE